MIYISLTTISPRLKFIQYTIDSLLNQTMKADKIILHIPTEYHNYDPADEKQLAALKGVEIHRCKDYGPATKLLAMNDLNLDPEDYIIVCDDDRMYEPNMVKDFILAHKANPRKVYSQARWDISDITNNAYSGGGVLGGCCGFIIQRRDCPFHFPELFNGLDPKDAKYYVDDVWLSGWITLNGIEILGMPRKPDAFRTANDRICELNERKDFPRLKSNTECAAWFYTVLNLYQKN
jgi:glycosyltransferase involved in cell wall biosynthesis